MAVRMSSLFLLVGSLALAVIIDRISIVVENRIVKESDIKRDIRVTSFLNNETPDLSLPSEKKAANRLIDQLFIRREIELGDYPTATLQQADQQLAGALLVLIAKEADGQQQPRKRFQVAAFLGG